MTCVQLDPEGEREQLREKVKRVTEFALAYEEWVDMILNGDNPWFDRMPAEFMDKFIEIQRAKNWAMEF
jgi:hypothetical protein